MRSFVERTFGHTRRAYIAPTQLLHARRPVVRSTLRVDGRCSVQGWDRAFRLRIQEGTDERLNSSLHGAGKTLAGTELEDIASRDAGMDCNTYGAAGACA